jgi:hypothetical protein
MNNEKIKPPDEETINLRNKIEYSADESEEGRCPKCGSYELDYGCSETDDGYIKYPWECGKCGSEGTEFGNIVFDGHEVSGSPYFEDNIVETSESNYKKYAIKCSNCGNNTFDFQWEEDHAVYKCENCHEFYDDGQEHAPMEELAIPDNIAADDGTLLAGLLSKFTTGDALKFFQNYDEESGETDGGYGVKMINEFDSNVLLFNYYGGRTAYTIDVTRDNTEEERFEHIKNCLHGYFNIIGFQRIFIRVEN